MKINSFIKIASGVLLSFFVCSCGKTNTASFKGDWLVTQVQLDGTYQSIGVTTVSILDEQKDKFHIAGGTVQGNSFNGVFKISESSNSIKCNGGLAVTKLLASPEVEEYEKNLCSILNNADYFKYGTEGDSEYIMISSKKNKGLVLLTRFKLSGAQWNYSGEKPEGAEAYVYFQMDGHARGFDGVNSFDLPYEFDAVTGSLKFSDGAMTMMLGADQKLMLLEEKMLNIFRGAAAYSVNGSLLTVKDEKGNVLGELEADYSMSALDKLEVLDLNLMPY